jgi:predicted amidophosphoribosyltransferase
MMRCLLCGKEKGEGSLMDILSGNDPLCSSCRKQWKRVNARFFLDGTEVRAPYLYNDAFSSALVQYKELYDEALREVFLYGLTGQIRHRYRGYTVICMPSTETKLAARGFSHLKEMFACTGLPVLEPFEKRADTEQKKKGRQERLKMRHAIVLKEGAKLPEKILLVDDTVTTGATLEGALSCLDRKAHQIRIFCISVNKRWI